MGLFSWNKKNNQEQNNTRQQARRPVVKDFTDSMTANPDLTKALYHNEYNGLKLAGGLAYPIIAVPVFFMGFPIAKSEDEPTSDLLKKISEEILLKQEQIHIQCHREGTIWIWPKYDSINRRVILEFISDDSVSDIIRNIDTGEIIAIYTDEEIKVTTGYNESQFVRRTRIFTKTNITVNYSGGTIPSYLKDKTVRNVLGILPVCFANNNDGNEVRGYSDYERVIYDLKRYHDIDLSEANTLAKFAAKMVQNVNDVSIWLGNNGVTSAADLDIETLDFILNVGEEKTDFVFPERATVAYADSLKRTFRKIVEASGVPELVWGVKTEGNANTAEEQMATLIKYVQDKQRRKNNPYKILFKAIALLYSIADNIRINTNNIKISWNDLDSSSDKVKSEIFRNFSQGLAQITNQAALTEQQIYSLWKLNFPKATEQDFETWQAGYTKAAVRRTLLNTDFATANESAGLVDDFGV